MVIPTKSKCKTCGTLLNGREKGLKNGERLISCTMEWFSYQDDIDKGEINNKDMQ